MMDFFAAGGFFMWPVLVTGLTVVALSARTVGRLRRSVDEDPGETRSGIDAILFSGGFGALLGVLGTLGGFAQMARAIEGAGDRVTIATLAGGFRVSLITSIFGLAIFLLALLLWLAFRAAQRRRRAPVPA